jgi:hypothetical protein
MSFFAFCIDIAGLKIILVKGRSPNGQKTHEEILSVPGQKGNANQNHVKIPLHSS